ncbi:MAG: CpsD/CapB family tyrosine-protein kinase [Ruminococcaceae bacterium]|nr:CpsD/CapB family tyrosine-protein kinase [Oscillospiraceae bacterium]
MMDNNKYQEKGTQKTSVGNLKSTQTPKRSPKDEIEREISRNVQLVKQQVYRDFLKNRKKDDETRKICISTSAKAPFNFAEAYRFLRTNINFIAATQETKSILITSATPNEAKTNIAINLAISLAAEGKNVILVDSDLRKPAVSSYLKISRNRPGFTDVLANRAELEDAIIFFKDVEIKVLPVGTIPPNPSELLSQKRTRNLIKILEESYDYVIVDSPPVSVVTDAAILSTYVSGTIFVIRSKFATRDAINLAKQRLEDVNAKILGVVISRYDARRATKRNAYTYTYEYEYGDK